MEKYESKIKVVKASSEAIFSALSDLSRVKDALPAQAASYLKDPQFSADEISFDVDKIGRIAVSIAEKTPASLVKYALKAAVPIKANIFMQIKDAPQPEAIGESRLKVTITADIPFMLKPLIGNKLQEAVDKIAEAISTRQF